VFATAVDTAVTNALATEATRDTTVSFTADTVSSRQRTTVAESRLLALLAEALLKDVRALPTPSAGSVASRADRPGKNAPMANVALSNL
jgi:hypothetical protein